MKIMIVGAGQQGHVLTWNLAQSPDVTEIVLGDYDEARAQEVAAQVGGDKTRPVAVDASSEASLIEAANGCEFLVNAVVPEFNMAVMRACLKLGAHYQDMASGQTKDKTIDEAFLEQLTLAEEFASAGLTALLSTGMDPGVTNTFAGNGYEDLDVCREIRVFSEVPIIMLTARGTEADRIVGLEIGADDYVVKPFSSGELIARIRALLRRTGSAPKAPAHHQFGELEIDEASRRATLAGDEIELSRKEFDLLAALVRDAGSVVSREELMSGVWDENWFGSTKTLDVHIGWLRKKLRDDPNDPVYIHTVRGVGFRFATPEEIASKA